MKVRLITIGCSDKLRPMTSAIISALQAELRHVASSASAPLMEFLDSCERVPETDSERFRDLAAVVGHEAKAIARIGQLFSWLTSLGSVDIH